jgi:hypothetical protein
MARVRGIPVENNGSFMGEIRKQSDETVVAMLFCLRIAASVLSLLIILALYFGITGAPWQAYLIMVVPAKIYATLLWNAQHFIAAPISKKSRRKRREASMRCSCDSPMNRNNPRHARRRASSKCAKRR